MIFPFLQRSVVVGRASGEVLAARWRERVARQRRSVGTVSDFCRREGVSKSSFYEWQRRLASRASVERAPPARKRSADRSNLTATRADSPNREARPAGRSNRAASHADRTSRARQASNRAAGFVELPAPAWPPSETAWPASDGIRIVLPNGATVALPAQVSADLLTIAIRAAMLPPEREPTSTAPREEDRPC